LTGLFTINQETNSTNNNNKINWDLDFHLPTQQLFKFKEMRRKGVGLVVRGDDDVWQSLVVGRRWRWAARSRGQQQRGKKRNRAAREMFSGPSSYR